MIGFNKMQLLPEMMKSTTRHQSRIANSGQRSTIWCLTIVIRIYVICISPNSRKRQDSRNIPFPRNMLEFP